MFVVFYIISLEVQPSLIADVDTHPDPDVPSRNVPDQVDTHPDPDIPSRNVPDQVPGHVVCTIFSVRYNWTYSLI